MTMGDNFKEILINLEFKKNWMPGGGKLFIIV